MSAQKPLSARNDWFMFHGRVHAADPSRGALRGRCGIQPLAAPTTQTLADGAFPPAEIVCRVCLVEVGMGHAEDEPLEAVRERGYAPSSAITP